MSGKPSIDDEGVIVVTLCVGGGRQGDVVEFRAKRVEGWGDAPVEALEQYVLARGCIFLASGRTLYVEETREELRQQMYGGQ